MVLLHVLRQLAAKNGWRLTVAHFNHRLRGAESDDDEQFVKETAAKWKLDFISGRADVGAVARREKISVEMAARKLRHDFLARTAKRLKIKTVALAHHADDQVELFFLRLLRGAGGEGVAGMKWTGPSPGNPTVEVVRPLLDQSKAMLRRFATEQKIAFREDATNAQLDFFRNRIRNKLLPLLSQKFQPAVTRSVLRTMQIVGAEADFVRQAAEDWAGQNRRRDFGKLHVAVQRHAIRMQLTGMRVAADFDLVEQLRISPNRPVSVGFDVTVYRDGAGRVHRQKADRSIFNPDQITVALKGGKGVFEFGGLQIRWQVTAPADPTKRRPTFTKDCEYFDADKVGPATVLRHWRAGDRFQPIGMGAPVKLQDLFVNRKFSRALRHQLVVATTAAGEVFWVEGLRLGDRFKLDKRTVRRLKWRWSGR